VVSSVYAEYVGGSQPESYHVAKAGLNQLVRYNAWVMGKKGIRINAIMPLTFLKDESRNYYLGNEVLMRLYQQFVPMGTIGCAEDSANLLEFLCSEKASFINGQAIFVDGGVSVIWPEELAKSMSGF
jgi:NAD(P)-dependent dehydrogenase (short-subunit alcohol dehydrogenase family)